MRQLFFIRAMMAKLWISLGVAMALVPGHSSLFGQTIDFETLPDGTAMTAGKHISTEYNAAPFGVSFQFEDGKAPVVRKVGGFNSTTGKPTAFYGWPNGTGNNTPAPGQNVGKFFLTDDNSADGPPGPLVITYAQPVAAASAFILDIDGLEAWDIYARNAAGQVISQVHLAHHTTGTGDGIATPWSFARPVADIKSIRIVYSGNPNATTVGLAFDNFSPSAALTTPALAEVAVDVTDGKVGMRITGTPSAVYRVEVADKPDGLWQFLTSVVFPADSSEIILTDIEPVNVRRFFRVRGAP